MKNIYFITCLCTALVFISCTDQAGSNKPAVPDTAAVNNTYDSAANNGILPPSAAPGNANNSSVADTTYKANDSSKK